MDDSLMALADQAARDLGLSRSALIAEALRDFLRNRREAQLSGQLNQAYPNEPTLEERSLVRRLKTKLPALDSW